MPRTCYLQAYANATQSAGIYVMQKLYIQVEELIHSTNNAGSSISTACKKINNTLTEKGVQQCTSTNLILQYQGSTIMFPVLLTPSYLQLVPLPSVSPPPSWLLLELLLPWLP